MSRFYSIPGTRTHQNSDERSNRLPVRDVPVYGDKPEMVSRPVKDELGNVLYHRQVFEGGFTPGLDEHDGATYHGDSIEKVADVFDRKAAKPTSIYRRKGRDGKIKGEIAVDHEQMADKGRDVVARSRRHKD